MNLAHTAWNIHVAHGDSFTSNPVSIQIGIASKCNLACDFCYTIRPDKSLEQSYITEEKFQEILDHPRLRHCVRVALSGGEPFLHPEIERLIALGRQRRKIMTVYTNGLVLTKRGMKVAENPPDAVCMSVYPEHFEKQREGLKTWLAAVPSKRRPVVICSTIVSKDTLDFLETAFEVSRDVGADLLFIQNLIPRFSERENAIWTTDRPEIDRIAALRNLYHSRVPSTTPTPLDAADRRMHCRQPFQYLSINTDGNISPCCGIYAFENEFGNVFEGEDIWNSDFQRSVRRTFRGSDEKYPSACDLCYMRHKEYTQIQSESMPPR